MELDYGLALVVAAERFNLAVAALDLVEPVRGRLLDAALAIQDIRLEDLKMPKAVAASFKSLHKRLKLGSPAPAPATLKKTIERMSTIEAYQTANLFRHLSVEIEAAAADALS